MKLSQGFSRPGPTVVTLLLMLASFGLLSISDGPGFADDEDAATLGEKVVLPPFLEPHRAQIVGNLKPID
jgi:hypothetical protein